MSPSEEDICSDIGSESAAPDSPPFATRSSKAKVGELSASAGQSSVPSHDGVNANSLNGVPGASISGGEIRPVVLGGQGHESALDCAPGNPEPIEHVREVAHRLIAE